ncbi:hypothetical protein ACTWPF_06865 [Oceanobacillus sp. M65]|uniref:hypothetical protein n=1 Tax=Oceanobacillus sp. M65 TaxID=3457435 RepID=UPI003FCD92FD
MFKKIDLNLYNKFNDLSLRYFELYPKDENKSLIFSAKVNLSFGIQDINRLIGKINYEGESKDSSWFYELIIKAYQILSAFDVIVKTFSVVKSGYDQLYGSSNEKDGVNKDEERQKIDYFRALRSLTTAHTLKTTDKSFEKFSITEGIYLEDIRMKSSYRFSQPDVDGDIILEIRKKDESSDNGLGSMEYRGIWIDKDIIDPVRIILDKLNIVNNKVEELIKIQENKLKNKKIENLKCMNNKFLIDLKRAVMERYPNEIEVRKYDNGKEEEFWEIQEIFNFVNWQYTFGDDRDLKLKALQDMKRNELLQYAEKVQGMELNKKDYYYTLSSGINREGIDYYCDAKISEYLKWNRNYPETKEIELWVDAISDASQINQVSNEVWACLMLKKMQPDLDKFFKIEWNTSFRELYWQYLVALFVRHQIGL